MQNDDQPIETSEGDARPYVVPAPGGQRDADDRLPWHIPVQYWSDEEKSRLTSAQPAAATEPADPMAAARARVLQELKQQDDSAWQKLFWRVASELKCLPSVFVADNEHVIKAARAAPAATAAPMAKEVSGLSQHSRAMLLNVLWHHQGGSSAVGQPLRAMLGIGKHDHLTDEQLAEARWIDGLLATPAAQAAPQAQPSDDDLIALAVGDVGAGESWEFSRAELVRLMRFTLERYGASPQAGEDARPIAWTEAEKVVGIPTVDEALEAFCNDSTRDNAVGLVQAVLEATPQPAAQAAPAVPPDLLNRAIEALTRLIKGEERTQADVFAAVDLRVLLDAIPQPAAQAVPWAMPEAQWADLRRRIMAAPRTQIEVARGVYASYLSQDAVADILDALPTQGASHAD